MELGGSKEIFIRGLKRMDEIAVGYQEYVFYKVDIVRQDSGTVLSPCCPSLLNRIRRFNGTMVPLHLGGSSSIVYIIGPNRNPRHLLTRSGEQEPEVLPDSIGDIACVNEANWIDLSDTDPKWRSAPCPTHNTCNPLCVPLSGQIYSLGHTHFKLEVYNHPNKNGCCWVELPRPPREIISGGSYVSFYPIPDPENDRIVVHMNPESAIYSFEPNNNNNNDNNNNNNQWKRLSPPGDRSFHWYRLSAIVDGVVCFVPNGLIHRIEAYDLADPTRLLQLEWSDTFPDFMRDIEFDELLNLGNGFLCLAVYTPLYFPHEGPIIPHTTSIYLVVLSLKRQTPGGAVTFTYHHYRQYDLPATISVVDYITLGA